MKKKKKAAEIVGTCVLIVAIFICILSLVKTYVEEEKAKNMAEAFIMENEICEIISFDRDNEEITKLEDFHGRDTTTGVVYTGTKYLVDVPTVCKIETGEIITKYYTINLFISDDGTFIGQRIERCAF